MFNDHKSSNILIIFMASLFCLDILNKLETGEQELLFYPIKMLKSAFLVYFLICLFKYKDLKTIMILTIIILIFIVNQFLFYFHCDFEISALTPNIRLFILFLFPLIFSSYVQKIILNDQLKFKLEKALFIILILTILTTVIGYIFDFKFFKTYPQSQRFGYLGLMPKSITASYFYICALLLTYYKFLINNERIYKWLFLTTLVVSLLVGTKAIYLFVPLLLFYHILLKKLYTKPYFYLTGATVSLLIFLFQQNILIFFKSNFSVLYNLYINKGFISALTSYRNEIFFDNLKIYYEVWRWYNYLFGGKVYETKLFESSLLDLISFFGFIGAGIYLTFFIYKSISNQWENKYLIFSISSILIISFSAGQFFMNISAISYVIVTFYLIKLNSQNETLQK